MMPMGKRSSGNTTLGYWTLLPSTRAHGANETATLQESNTVGALRQQVHGVNSAYMTARIRRQRAVSCVDPRESASDSVEAASVAVLRAGGTEENALGATDATNGACVSSSLGRRRGEQVRPHPCLVTPRGRVPSTTARNHDSNARLSWLSRLRGKWGREGTPLRYFSFILIHVPLHPSTFRSFCV